MGCFDQIKCKIPFPTKSKRGDEFFKTKKNWYDHTFSTKDLENCLLQYEIRRSGLWKRNNDKLQRAVDRKWSKDDYSGYVKFNDVFLGKENDLLVEFRAYFKDGKLQGEVECLKWNLKSNNDRKVEESEIKKRLKKRAVYEKKLCYKYCLKYWNKLVTWLFKKIRKIHEWKSRMIPRLENWLTF